MNNFRWLDQHSIRSVIDIGANVGKFSNYYSDFLPNAKFYAFEPIKSVYAQLQKNTAGLNIECFQLALGNSSEDATINVNDFSPSSSLLAVDEIHDRNFGHKENQKELIRIERLDDVLRDVNVEDNIFVKIDVQGVEDLTIAGGVKTLARAKLALIEVSYVPLYKEQCLFGDIFKMLAGLGFEFHGCLQQVCDKDDGSILYGDALFINHSIGKNPK